MATYTVTFEQWVQEIAEIEIEADSLEEALELAENETDDLDWEDGPGADFRGVSEVKQPDGSVWVPQVEEDET